MLEDNNANQRHSRPWLLRTPIIARSMASDRQGMQLNETNHHFFKQQKLPPLPKLSLWQDPVDERLRQVFAISQLDLDFKEKYAQLMMPLTAARKMVTVAVLSVLWMLTLIQSALHVFVQFTSIDQQSSVTFIASVIILAFQSVSFYVVFTATFFDPVRAKK